MIIERKLTEKTGCKIICGAPTTLAVHGLMMMMMMMMMMIDKERGRKGRNLHGHILM